MQKTLIDSLKWRYACKAMNGQKVPEHIINDIVTAINLAPTSLGLQLFKVFVIENEDIKKQIRSVANDQQAIEGCSHLFVFAAQMEVKPTDIKSSVDKLVKLRNYDNEKANSFFNKLSYFVSEKIGNNQPQWLIYQTYIALGIAIAAVAEARVYSVPIEGFDKNGVDKILGLTEKGYKSTLLLPVGYTDPEQDWMYNQTKVRKDKEQIVEFIK